MCVFYNTCPNLDWNKRSYSPPSWYAWNCVLAFCFWTTQAYPSCYFCCMIRYNVQQLGPQVWNKLSSNGATTFIANIFKDDIVRGIKLISCRKDISLSWPLRKLTTSYLPQPNQNTFFDTDFSNDYRRNTTLFSIQCLICNTENLLVHWPILYIHWPMTLHFHPKFKFLLCQGISHKSYTGFLSSPCLVWLLCFHWNAKLGSCLRTPVVPLWH